MSITKDRRDQLNDIAERTRDILKIRSSADLEPAIRKLGGEVVRSRHDPYEASVEKIDGDRFRIRLDDGQPTTRTAFSLAHELAHLIIHMGFGHTERWSKTNTYTALRREGYTDEEFEANEFAAALLMPRQAFREEFERTNSIDSVADAFGVSKEAARVRGRWLGLIPWE